MAKKGCTTCFSQELKDMIAEAMPNLEPLLNEIPVCDDDDDLKVCLDGGKGSKKKRAPSAYNTFIGTCMKSGRGMKDCAADYKRQKGS